MKLHDLFDGVSLNQLSEVLGRRSFGKGLLGLGSTAVAPKPAQANIVGYDPYADCTAKNADVQHEDFLINYAKNSGIHGKELAAFLAQLAHESGGFKKMEQIGTHHNRYRGRGYIQLSGKASYEEASDYLSINLIKHPEWAALPETAAKIAVWFWNTKVKPHVRNWDNIEHITKVINPHLRGLADRIANYKYYLSKMSNKFS
jgi:predicted chitinase